MGRYKATWSHLKSVQSANSTPLFYMDDGAIYEVWTWVGGHQIYTSMKKDGGSDQTDFDNNFKSSSNPVSGYVQKVSTVQYADREFKATTDVSIDGNTSHTILDCSLQGIAKGKLSFVNVRLNDSDFEVEIIADGVTSSKVLLDDLKKEHKFTEDLQGSGHPFVSDDGKQYFRLNIVDFHFNSTLVIKVHNKNSGAKKLYSYYIGIKEELA